MTPNRPTQVNAALLAARLAAQNRSSAQDNYRDALHAAWTAGASYSELAAVIGTTRQAVRQYLLTN